MTYILFILLFTALYGKFGAKGVDISAVHLNTITELPNNTTSTATAATTPSSQDDYLDNISIQDVLSSDIDANERVEKKIISAIKEYSSNCGINKHIDLSLESFSFPHDSVTIDSGTKYIIFHNLRISKSTYDDDENKRKLYSTTTGCDSSRTATVSVEIPKNIQITADLKVTRHRNSSKNFQSDVINTGSISLSLKNNSISIHFSIRTDNSTNYKDNITSKLYFSKSEVSLEIDKALQMHIYTILEDFYNEVELPIRQFLIAKLEAELFKNGIAVANSCAKVINADKNSRKINLPFFNNNLNNLYVISNVNLETWKGVNLSAGPIIIDGLTSFNSTELTVIESELSSPDGLTAETYYYTTSRYNDPEIKQRTIRIKTNNLKGKLDWSYNSRQRSFPFSIEFIQFEIKSSGKEYDYSSGYYPSRTYTRSNYDTLVVNMNLYLGNIYIKSSKSNACENENEFIHFVLSEYLKTVIANSLKTSIVRKLQNESIFVNCN